MATMREVAARAGVSPKTVSRVFNGDAHVTPETRERVEQVMRELNYVPNLLATTFRSGSARVVGVAVPDIVDPHFGAIARAVEDVARERGLSTLVTSTGNDPDAERAQVESLLARQLTGLVIVPVGADHSWLERWQERTPIVFVDRAPRGITADTFTDDDHGGALAGTRHLLTHGHRRIGYLGDLLHLSTEAHRLRGYRAALVEEGVEPDDELVRMHVDGPQSAATALERLASLASPPTAVFSSNARTTVAVLHALDGDRVPLVCFGDFPLADLLDPPLTVLDQNPARLGELAARRVFDRVEHPSKRLARANVLDVALIERGSCDVVNPGQ
ncbi:MAG: LacI family DNA-binding transcriptional regulator [Microbacterium sp.]|uniref:LacI family DNA-binding transcriptional regulator n=1 Tax=Microbacterium sp. TaxID=51671 RepID=UPI0039E2873D